MARNSTLPWAPEAGKRVITNVGNTHVRVVTYVDGTKTDDRRLPTREAGAIALDAAHVVMVSVVPEVADALAARWTERGSTVFRVTTTALASDYVGLGHDRMVNALALWRGWGAGIAIDCGTATTLTLVDGTGRIRGGAILPGLTTARDSLWTATAQLPAVPLEVPPHAIGTSTLESLQVGLVLGHVGALQHLVALMQAEVPAATHLVVTGGWGACMAPLLHAEHAPDLTIEGAGWAFCEATSSR